MGQIYVWAKEPEVTRLFSLLLAQESHEVWGTAEQSTFQTRLSIAIPDICLIDIDYLEAVESFCDWYDDEPMLHACPCLYIAGRVSRQEQPYAQLMRRGVEMLEKPLQRDPFVAKVEWMLAQSRQSSLRQVSLGIPAEDASEQSFSSPELEAAMIEGHRLNRVDGRRVGSVLLQHEIGRGGMGIVFKGRQTSLGRDVAVKMILPKLLGNQEMLARLQREALAIAQIKSKHIVRVFDAGYTSEEIFFIVMEWLSGEDLERQLVRDGPMSIIDALKILRQLAMGLQAAHKKGLIHRDIKPSNVILDRQRHATLTDFGLAKQYQQRDARLTSEGTVLGTVDYLSPEQITGAVLDHRTDIYSLGIVFFEMLAGYVPFSGSQLTEVMHRHLFEPLPDLRTMGPRISHELWLLMTGMAAKEPQERMQSCAELVQAIDQQLAIYEPTFAREQSFSHARMGHQTSVHSTPLWAELSREIPTRLSSLSSSFLIRSQLDPSDQIGSFRMSLSGLISQVNGNVHATWEESLQVLVAIIQQLEATAGLGFWEETLYEALPQSVLFGLDNDEILASLFLHQHIPASVRMVSTSAHITRVPAGHAQESPLQALSAAAGVKGLVLLTEQGQFVDSVLAPGLGLDDQIFAQQLSPLAHLFGALPFRPEGMDFTFEHGRLLLWILPHHLLFVIASHRVNKTLLSLLIFRYREHLVQMSAPIYTPAPQTRLRRDVGSQPHPLEQAVPHGPLPALALPQPAAPQPSLPPPSSIHHEPDIEMFLSDMEIQSIQYEFARYIGPMARLIWKRVVRKMGLLDDEVPQERAKALIQRLAQHLDSPKRYSFLEDVQRIST